MNTSNNQPKNNIQKRHLRLQKYLKKYGLEMRENSKICNLYLSKKVSPKSVWNNVHNVIDRLCELRFLNEYCNIKNIMKELKREEQNRDLSHYEIFTAAENVALERFGDNGNYPKVYPWFNDIGLVFCESCDMKLLKLPTKICKKCVNHENFNKCDCSVCLDFDEKYICQTLPCNHTFHKKCIINWLISENGKNTCPNCRVGFDPAIVGFKVLEYEINGITVQIMIEE
jgi:hypothetical protein